MTFKPLQQQSIAANNNNNNNVPYNQNLPLEYEEIKT